MSRDPLLVDNQGQPVQEQRLPDEWRVKYLQRPVDRLPGDVVKAFDRLWHVEREKDRIAARLELTQKKLRHAKLQIWVMTLVVSPLIAEGARLLLHWMLGH